jgi:predicted MFS family arabinose efflux permease
LLLAIVVLAVVYVRWDENHEPVPVIPFVPRNWLTSSRVWMIVVLLMLFVCYRSFAGEVFSKGITKSQTLILVIGSVSMLGKMAGGWIARWMGVLRSLAVVLAGVALCILLRGDSVAVLLVGIFLMNCTMPVTLYLANDVLPGREGLAFGLLAAALIPGYLLAVYL